LQKYSLPVISTRQTLAPRESTSHKEVSSSQIISIKLENHLPEGALIRAIYKKKDQKDPVFVDEIFELPGKYTVRIPVLREKEDTLLKLIAVQGIDLQNNNIIQEFSQRRLQSEDAPERISLIRTKKTGREQLPPLETPKNRLKPIRRSPLPISTLLPISEDGRDDESLSKTTFSTHSPSISPTSSQSFTSPSTSSLSLESLAEETEEDEEVI
jgi:hypothetical protein